MSRINSREEFKNYCMRQLGAPVLRINVDEQQVEDRIDDALDLFWEYHSDGSENVWLHIQVTDQHKQQRYFQLPADTQSVLRVVHGGSGMGSNGIANTNLQYQAYITDMMNPRKIVGNGLSEYYVTQSYLSLLNDTFSSDSRIQFNQHYDKLHIIDSWDLISVGSFVAIEVYQKVTPEKSGDVWNNRWLKKYAAAQIKKQWGTNLIKFTNANLPGGVQMNGQTILEEARDEIDKLKAELHDLYETPASFFVG